MTSEPGEDVAIMVENDRLAAEPRRPRYTLTELLDASNYSEPETPEEREWLDAEAAGRELL
jgi:antitoxin ChpS